MKIRSLILFVLAAVVCGAFLCADSQAKVCFLGESCGTGYNFADGEPVPEELNKLCKKEGYNVDAGTGSAAKVCGTNQIEYKCPYSARWRMCCGADYTYSQCGAGLVSKGVCGGKHKCECDTSLFPYKQASATMCSKYDSSVKFENSLAAGASCVYSSLQSGSLSMVSRFEKCMCDRGLYPKPASECEEGGAAGAGIKCTDSDGNNFYQTCECNYSLYPILATTCEFGTYTSDKLCQEGALYYAPKCCECTLTEYPYRSSPDTTKVKEWVSCKSREHCTGGGAVFRATKCQKGYKLSGGECVPVSCDEAVQIYLADSGNTTHAVLKSDGAYISKKTTSNGEDHYTWQKVNDNTARTYIVSGNVSVYSAATTGSTPTSTYCTAFQCKTSDAGKKSYSSIGSGCTCSNCCEYRMKDPEYTYNEPGLGNDDLLNGGLGNNNRFEDEIIKDFDEIGYYYCSSSIGCSGVCNPEVARYKVCISTGTRYSYTYKGIAGAPSNGSSETYISALKYLSSFSTSAINKDVGLSAMKRSCTVNPTLTYSASKFPVTSEGDSAPTMYFKDVNLKFSSTTTSSRPIVMEGGDLNVGYLTQNKSLIVKGGDVSGSSLTASGDVTLTANSGTTPTYTVGTSTFKTAKTSGVLTGKFTSTGYNINVNDIYFSVAATATSSEVAKITLGANGTLKALKSSGYGLHLHPSSDAKASTFNSYVSIVGPNSSTGAKVYSHLYVGNKERSYTPLGKGFQVKFSGNVSYEMIDGYRVTLAPSCDVTATDYGSGYTSKINWSTSGTAWKRCYTNSTIWEPFNNKGVFHCNNDWKTDTAGASFVLDGETVYKYFITSIGADSSRTLVYGGYSRWKQADCGYPTLNFPGDGTACYDGCKTFIWCD